MNTLSIPHKRKPDLQIRCLREICIVGLTYVNQIEKILKPEGYHHSDIFKSFEVLTKKGLIRPVYRNAPREIHPGKKRKYYCLTEHGIKALLKEEPSPKLFWRASIGFWWQNKNEFTSEMVDNFYSSFLGEFLNYPSAVGYVPILQHLTEAYEHWTAEHFQDKKSLTESILNFLAKSPGKMLEKIKEEIGINVTQIEKVLERYSLDSLDYSNAYYVDESDYDSFFPAQFKDYIIHNLFSISYSSRGKMYSLSLFGIILYLWILRRRTVQNPEIYEELFYRLAKEYHKKLPLVFGKVGLLRKIIHSLTAYNFDLFLLNGKDRSQIMNHSILSGGNKEYLQNMYSLSTFTYLKLSELYSEGLSATIQNHSTGEEFSIESIPVLNTKLQDLRIILTLGNPMYTLPDHLDNTILQLASARIQGVNPSYLLEHPLQLVKFLEAAEKILATEISFLYYLHLDCDMFVPVGFGIPQGGINQEYIEWQMSRLTNNEPKQTKFLQQKLLRILNYDREIGRWFDTMIAASVKCQKEVLTVMERNPLLKATNNTEFP